MAKTIAHFMVENVRIGAIAVPTLVLHGELDRVVPIAFGERLYAASAMPRVVIDSAERGP